MARIRGKQELIARLLQLVRMHVDATDAGQALEPWEFMLQQQAGPQTYVMDALKVVKKCDDDQLETIAQLIRLELAPILNEKRRLVLAFDDIEIGLSINAGCFPREPGELRSSGVIVPLAAAASQLQGFINCQIVFAGTGALTDSVKIETFVTGVGKGRESNCINSPQLFPTCCAHDVERLLSRLSLPDDLRTELSCLERRPLDENMPEAPSLRDRLEFMVVGGRFGLLCDILESIGEAITRRLEDSTPTGLLNMAAEMCIERHTADLLNKFKFRLTPGSAEYLGDDWLTLLHQIYVATALSGNGTSFWESRASQKNLVALGVAVSAQRREKVLHVLA